MPKKIGGVPNRRGASVPIDVAASEGKRISGQPVWVSKYVPIALDQSPIISANGSGA